MKAFFLANLMAINLLFVMSSNAQNISFESTLFVTENQDTVTADLGTFKVPENRSKQNGKMLTLKFIRFKSTNPNPGAPIVYLAGGPGGSGTGTAKGRRFELFMKLRAVADVIAFDQRGTGLSNEIPGCPHSLDLDLGQPMDRAAYMEKSKPWVKKCMEFWETEGHDLQAYKTIENANDLDDLRKGLGAEKISLWGISYGSHLTFEYIRRFEKHLDKVVIAGLEGPDETIKLPSNADAFIKMICEEAEDNYGNDPKYPDLEQKIKAVHEKVQKEPLFVPIKNMQGETDTLGISYYEFQFGISGFYLRDPQNSSIIPSLYTEMYNGNFTQLAQNIAYIKLYFFRSLRPMSFAMDMSSGISPKRNRQIEAEIPNSYYGTTLNGLYYDWMSHIDFKQLPDDFRKLKKNKVDALLLSGTHDGRTFLSAGKTTAKSFLNGKHVIVENAGHNIFMTSPKVVQLVVDFFKGKAIESTSIKLEPAVFK